MKHVLSAKRFLSGITAAGLLALFCLCPLSAAADNESESPYTEISDAAGLAAITSAPEGNYRLTKDIDLGSDWKPIPFRGKLDGNGHILYNLHVTDVGQDKRVTRDGNMKEYDTEFAGLFSVLENAEVSNLTLKGAFVDIAERSHCFAAILAGYCDNSVVNGCSVEGRVHMKNSGVNAGVAGIVGYGNGFFEECNAEVELIFDDRYREGKCEQFLGGILSCGIGKIKKCNVQINGYVSCHGYAHNGGIVGMYHHCGMDYTVREISYCVSKGQISFFEDNDDRRAYCSSIGGELLTPPKKLFRNRVSFKRNEVWDYSKILSPEECEQPDYEETVTPPDCTDWGYTAHKCRGCDYSWTDTYTPPQHDNGEWTIVSDSDYEREGLKRQYCNRCGKLTGEETIPVKKNNKTEISLQKKSNSKTIWAIAASAGILLIVETGAMVYSSRKKSSTNEEIQTENDTSEGSSAIANADNVKSDETDN